MGSRRDSFLFAPLRKINGSLGSLRSTAREREIPRRLKIFSQRRRGRRANKGRQFYFSLRSLRLCERSNPSPLSSRSTANQRKQLGRFRVFPQSRKGAKKTIGTAP